MVIAMFAIKIFCIMPVTDTLREALGEGAPNLRFLEDLRGNPTSLAC